MELIKSKKGLSLGDMYPAVLSLVLIGVVLGIGLYVLAQFQLQIGNSSTPEWNAVNDTITGLATLPNWIPIIVTVIAAAIILGLVLNTLGGSRRQ